MKTKYISVMIAALMILLIILISGCGGESASSSATAPATAASTSGCPSPYDGTWKGVMADSGDLSVMRYDVHGGSYETLNPFTAQYDLEITLKCNDIKTSEASGWSYLDITHMKASHPIFDCANGCTPKEESYISIANDGSGGFSVSFPNGAYIPLLFVEKEGRLRAGQDVKTINLLIHPDFSAGQNIGWIPDLQGEVYTVETYNCQKYGGKGSCFVKTILPNTITLTKVS